MRTGTISCTLSAPTWSSAALDALAREMCDRHTGIGADGLIVYEHGADAVSMQLFNADGSRAEVSGNGVRALAALVLQHDTRMDATLTIQTEAGAKHLSRIGLDGSRHTFRASMGSPIGLGQIAFEAAGESLELVVLNIGNPQCVLLGPLPDAARFRRLGAALERHQAFPEGTNVEFADVETPARVRILIWERGVGPTTSSGTGSCAALVAARRVRRRRSRRGCHRARRRAARRMEARQRVPDRLGRSVVRRRVAAADSSYPLEQSPINFCVSFGYRRRRDGGLRRPRDRW